MEGQDYLNQISAKVRPEKQSKMDKIKSSKLFWIVAGGIILFIIIMIIGGILSGAKTSGKELAFSLKLHLDNTEEVIQEYQSKVKSSTLRSSSASLYSILSNTNRDLTELITTLYNYNEKSVSQTLTEQAQLELDGLKADLFEAKINGNLDRIYAHKMTYEISMIMNEENKLYDNTSSDELKKVLETSYSSLENLYDKFNDFSETK